MNTNFFLTPFEEVVADTCGRHTEELAPVRVLETLPTDVLRKTGGLPSKVIPPFLTQA